MTVSANKIYMLRGAYDQGPYEVKMRDISGLAVIAWRKWEGYVAHVPLRDLLALVYAEGIAHGSLIERRGIRATPAEVTLEGKT